MKINYSSKDDVLMVELGKGSIDYAEQTGNIIVHFSPKREALLLEILDASKLLKDLNKALPGNVKREIFTQPQTIAHRVK